jgi:hypothetical protein
MKYRYFDACDLRLIDEIAREVRQSADSSIEFEARRRRIFDLYLDGIQTREAIFEALANDRTASMPTR